MANQSAPPISVAPLPADDLAWLSMLLAAHPTAEMPEDMRPAIHDRLARIPFQTIIQAAETAGETRRPAVAQLYRWWIATVDPRAAHLFAAWFNAGVEMARLGHQAEAILAYRNSLVLRPDFHAAALNLGTLLEQIGQPEAALAAWNGALQPETVRTKLLNQQGRLLETMGRLDEAEKILRRSLAADPSQPDVIQHWVHLRQQMCDWPLLREDIPGLPPARMRRECGPLAILALTDRVAEQCEATGAWITQHTTAPGIRLAPAGGYRHARIRIGYLSSDFCRHAMSYLVAELFERHDRTRFEVYGYCASRDDGSDLRARVLGAFDHVRLVRDLSDEQAARRIREDEIDILVDLNGLTAGSRIQVLRYRPAPVQATYLGFIGPVPLPELDYVFCDAHVVPKDVARLYHPRPLYIAHNYQANDNRRVIGRVPTRAEIGLPENRFLFCCAARHYKITEEMFGAWMEILRRTGNTVLWLIDDNVWSRANLLAHAARLGVDPARLVFTGRADPAEYIARLTLADLFLDTFPYNTGTVASDALRMGVPMLTRSGESFASRMAGRLLLDIGAAEGVVESRDAYVETAVAFANEPRRLAAYRSRLGGGAWAASIGNVARFTIEYESTLISVISSISENAETKFDNASEMKSLDASG
ncbi:Acetylglucosamine transferase (plasmid) [Rhodovastum atsumiense]|uniref:O-linked N-acetylglucosamine transferase, SPINDLY family protein n=1 Tax=Rhodovastum atsumiense TaxID=504468 RepID=UPI00202501FF|nr:glycosyl transferase family 1 [Rhodovastum atsumiense]CAH2605421.1 Acetylglucosamine transferase [Rhodovastum atsumiense]